MRERRGFTLIELLISVMIFLLISGVAVQFMRRQSGLVARETTRMDALQNAQFAASQLERELREAGAGVLDIQPMLVQLDSDAITFNANMVSIDSGDVRAVYQMRDADPDAVRGLLSSEAVTLPNSSPAVNYPDTTYAMSGVTTNAETISYWLRPDSSSSIAKRYVLFRRVNALAPTLVARGIVKDSRDSVPMLTYFTADTLGALVAVAKNKLPIIHAKVHGTAADTGRRALTDSIRVVRVHFLTAARDPRTGKDALRTVEAYVRLMNSGLLEHTSCGQPPYGATSVTATSSPATDVVKRVTVKWTRSSDDGGGERDIQRYAIYRRSSTAATFGDPFASIPASSAAYSFSDGQVVPDSTYVYGVVAQDCTPLLSSMAVSSPVTVSSSPVTP
jgi:prepilin-type N-terminal cleavage/methylation domain-containing protein